MMLNRIGWALAAAALACGGASPVLAADLPARTAPLPTFVAPAPVATREPEARSAAVARPAPMTVWVRRRAAPDRRMTVARGQRMSSSGPARAWSSRGMSVVGASRCNENCELA